MLVPILRRAFVVAAASLALAASTHASAYSGLYAFGDSLSDVGNVFSLTGNPPPPYYNGQWSNGNVWLQTLAGDLALAPLTPSLLGGTDYAYGGAQSGGTIFHTANSTDVMGASGQIAQFQAAHPGGANPGALYTIWIGGNDLLGISGSATAGQIQTLAGQTIGNIDSAIGALAGAGAKDFLVLTLPNVGKTPAALASGSASTASAIAASFNSLLLNGNAGAGIPSLSALATGLGLNLSVFDAYAYVDDVVANPAAHGFTNVTSACFNGSTVCANPNEYLFWDSIHPTAASHLALGNAVAAAVPEPATWAMMIVGFGIVGVALRRRA
jgi:phospholipase/lecithinase/hemolysin